MPMSAYPQRQFHARAQHLTERAIATLNRFLHIQAASGIVLLLAAAAALIWANSPLAHSYHAFWHAPITIGFGDFIHRQTLHFWINDGLMAIFFLVVGMEIRREIHEGALCSLKLAALPLAAALGGVVVPALIYLAINGDPVLRQGWAIPTATDIAFAVGVLALLGRGIPSGLRVFLLALAIIDDVVAILIIAIFYSGGLDYSGLLVAGLGIAMVLGMQQMGIGNAWAYVLPGAAVWIGLLQTGAHPTLAGVVLGLMTPVLPRFSRVPPLEAVTRAAQELGAEAAGRSPDTEVLGKTLNQMRKAQRELLPPVIRVEMALHPWVAFGIMPLFALANAGVTIDSGSIGTGGAVTLMSGIVLALVAGKPLGVLCASWIAVRLGLCSLPQGVNWRGVTLVGLLAGIGFTMSIFIATLAFDDAGLLDVAKLAVLLASLLAASLGIVFGLLLRRQTARTPEA